MSYNKTVNDFQFRWIQGLINPWNMIFTLDASLNIMFHGLINPCIHLIESHQLYIISIFIRYKNCRILCIFPQTIIYLVYLFNKLCTQKPFDWLVFQSVDYECTWWRLFQKHVMHTNLVTRVFIKCYNVNSRYDISFI